MRLMTKTSGVMPTREEFDRLWTTKLAAGNLRDNKFHFGNDKRMGNCALTRDEFWTEINKAYKEAYEDPTTESDSKVTESTSDWLSSVLGCLGLEWV